MTERMTTLELLKAGRNRIATKGWTRGTLGPVEGPNCTIGGLFREVETQYTGITNSYQVMQLVWRDKAYRQAIQLLTKIARPITTLAQWNDHFASTEKVLAVYDEAIAQLEAAAVIEAAEEIVREAPAREPASV